MDDEYRNKLQEFKDIQDSDLNEPCEEIDDLIHYLLSKNSFENPMDRLSAEKIIDCQQRRSLGFFGGYPLWDEVSFVSNGEEYAVIAYGASGEKDGEGALFGMIFVKEDKESRKSREWGRFKTERDFVRFNKYLDEVKKGLREPNGKDEFGIVPYVCEKCKREEATVFSSKGHFCSKCSENGK